MGRKPHTILIKKKDNHMVKHRSIKHASVRCHHPFDDFYYHDFQFHTCDGIRIVRQSMRCVSSTIHSGAQLDRTVSTPRNTHLSRIPL